MHGHQSDSAGGEAKLDNGAVLSVMQKPGNADQALRQAEALRSMVAELQEIRCMLEHQEESCKARRVMLEECISNIQNILTNGRGVTSSTSRSSSSSAPAVYVQGAKRMRVIGERH